MVGTDAGANSKRASNMVQYKEQKIKVLYFHLFNEKKAPVGTEKIRNTYDSDQTVDLEIFLFKSDL